jgi:glycolate oxidase FAD binding subunit
LRDLLGDGRVTESSPRETETGRGASDGQDTKADFAIYGRECPLQVRPGSVEQMAAALAFAHAEKLGVCVTGGGSKLAWGNKPDRFDFLVSTRESCLDCTVDADDLTMTAGAGVTLADARAQARAMNRLLPLDSGKPTQATVGGIAATGDQGPRGAEYGRVRDLILGLKATLADGTSVAFGGRTMKNVAGYDMPKLFSGSFGGLGVITEIVFRLLPLPDAQGLAVHPLSSLVQGEEIAAKLLDSRLRPLALEVASPELAASLKTALPARCSVDPDRPLFLAAFAGHPAAVERSLGDVCRWLGAPTQTTLADAVAEAFLDDLAEYSAATAAQLTGTNEAGQDRLYLAARAFVPISQVWSLAQAAESLAQAADLSLAFRIGAVQGTVDLWVGQQAASDPRPDSLLGWVENLRKAAVASGGQLMVTNRQAALADPIDAWTPPGAELRLMQRLKEKFDPHHVLSPGRFVGGL